MGAGLGITFIYWGQFWDVQCSSSSSFFLSWVNWLRGCSSIPMDVLPRLFIGPILVILLKKMCICTVHHKNLYHAKSSNINLCFSDSKTFGSSCNWSYSGLMLSWRSGIKCCNIHIQGKCCTLCSYDNVCLKCIPLFVCLFFLILYWLYFLSYHSTGVQLLEL